MKTMHQHVLIKGGYALTLGDIRQFVSECEEFGFTAEQVIQGEAGDDTLLRSISAGKAVRVDADS